MMTKMMTKMMTMMVTMMMTVMTMVCFGLSWQLEGGLADRQDGLLIERWPAASANEQMLQD